MAISTPSRGRDARGGDHSWSATILEKRLCGPTSLPSWEAMSTPLGCLAALLLRPGGATAPGHCAEFERERSPPMTLAGLLLCLPEAGAGEQAGESHFAESLVAAQWPGGQ